MEFENEEQCGGCARNDCPAPGDSDMLLLCELCPAAYHYVCAGYYDAAGVGSTHLSTVPAADLLLPLLAALICYAL